MKLTTAELNILRILASGINEYQQSAAINKKETQHRAYLYANQYLRIDYRTLINLTTKGMLFEYYSHPVRSEFRLTAEGKKAVL